MFFMIVYEHEGSYVRAKLIYLLIILRLKPLIVAFEKGI